MSNRSSPSPGRQSFWPRDGDFVRLTSWSPGNVPRGMWGVRLESGQAQSGPQHEMPHNEKCHPKHGISSSDGPSANCRAAIAAKSIIPPLFSFESSGGSPTDQGSGKGMARAHQTRSERAVSPRLSGSDAIDALLEAFASPRRCPDPGGVFRRGNFDAGFQTHEGVCRCAQDPPGPQNPCNVQCDREKSGGNRWADPIIHGFHAEPRALPRPLPGPAWACP